MKLAALLMALAWASSACATEGSPSAPAAQVATGGQGVSASGGAGTAAGGAAQGGSPASRFARELLYENDLIIEAVAARPRRVHVDESHVYWVGSAYFRAPKNGSGTRERLADFNYVLMPRAIQTDARNVYLKQETGLDVIPKDGSPRYFVAAPIEWGSTGAYYTSGGLIVFASNQCTRFAALELDGSAPRLASFDAPWEVSGGTNVLVVGGLVYCVNEAHGLRWDPKTTTPELLFEMPLGHHSFVAMASNGSALLLTEGATGGQKQNIRLLPLPAVPGSEPTIWCPGGEARGNGGADHFDPARNALFWNRAGTLSPLDLMTCSLSGPQGQPTVRLDYESQGEDVQGFAGDETYFYWGDESGVWRARKPDL